MWFTSGVGLCGARKRVEGCGNRVSAWAMPRVLTLAGPRDVLLDCLE